MVLARWRDPVRAPDHGTGAAGAGQTASWRRAPQVVVKATRRVHRILSQEVVENRLMGRLRCC
jgi:hypothetical protein